MRPADDCSATMQLSSIRILAMTFRPLTARDPGALLRDAKPLRGLVAQAERLGRLQALLESQLQPAAREHCHVAAWQSGCLLLIITDGHWATRLRYQQRRLQRQLMAFEAFEGLQRIQFKVQPSATAPRPAGRQLTISREAADDIRANAEHISDDKLRAALQRLASHAPAGPGSQKTCTEHDGES
jgi:hypothetical protein